MSLGVPLSGPMGELLRAALVGTAFLLILAAGEAWHRLRNPPVEWTRKLVHTGGGVVAAFFPWVLRSPWSVVALAAAFGAILAFTRKRGLLKSVHGVERESQGGLYYPLAICLLFAVGHTRPVFYLISMLVLLLADTAAALLGSAYGRTTFGVETDRRSLEGSAAFFFTAFLCVHLPLLLGTGVDRLASVLIALQLALLVTCFEAISLRGNDNLLLPPGTFYLLVKMTPHPAEWIALQLLLQLAILGLVGGLAGSLRFLSFSGALAAHLFFYGALSLCGPEWLVPPLLALAGFAAVYLTACKIRGETSSRYQVRAVFWVTLAPVALFLAKNAFATLYPGAGLGAGHGFFIAYTGALAGHLALSAARHVGRCRPEIPGLRVLAGTFLGAVLLVGPLSLRAGTGGLAPAALSVVAGICLLSFVAYAAGRRWLPVKDEAGDLRIQSGAVMLAVLATCQQWLAVGGSG